MNLYRQIIFPRLLDWSMSAPELSDLRQQSLAHAEGDILEVGFGTGLNLAFYPDSVQGITTLDVNPGMNSLAQKRISKSGVTVKHLVANGEQMPIPDQSFDTVVSTWTLCSIKQIDTALSEIHRVLRPNGKFIFIEHGLGNRPNIQLWQNRLTPLQKVIADGCHLNRDIKALLDRHFSHVELKQFALDGLPSVIGYTYQGMATR